MREALGALKPTEGTAIGDAVLLSARLGLKQRASDGSTPPTTVLLISDGARDGGQTAPRAAAQRARQMHVPVYTVLVGTPNGVVRHQLPGGYTETIRVPPSPQTLQLIANTTGAQFFRAASEKQLREVYENLGSRLGHKTANARDLRSVRRRRRGAAADRRRPVGALVPEGGVRYLLLASRSCSAR